MIIRLLSFSVLVFVMASCGGGGSGSNSEAPQTAFEIIPAENLKQEYEKGIDAFFLGEGYSFIVDLNFEENLESESIRLGFDVYSNYNNNDWSLSNEYHYDDKKTICYELKSDAWVKKSFFMDITSNNTGSIIYKNCGGDEVKYIKETIDISGKNISDFFDVEGVIEDDEVFPFGSSVLLVDRYFTNEAIVVRTNNVSCDDGVCDFSRIVLINSIGALSVEYPFLDGDDDLTTTGKLFLGEGSNDYYLTFDDNGNIYYYLLDDETRQVSSTKVTSKLREEVYGEISLYFFDMPEELKIKPQVKRFITKIDGEFVIGEKTIPWVVSDVSIDDNVFIHLNSVASEAVHGSLIDPVFVE